MSNCNSNYLTLSAFYETCLSKYGATPQGVDWPNQADVIKRFKIMLDVFHHEQKDTAIQLLDLGCGYGALVDYLKQTTMKTNIIYTGVDISDKMITAARALFPEYRFLSQDILNYPFKEHAFDYIIMNGLLTEKRTLAFEEMVSFAKRIISQAYKICRKGLAFNVMNPHVDWCNPDLFYWSFDDVTAFLFQHCTRHVVIRNDYGLYEYTIYAYKTQRA